jgi:protein-tyrosine phosphatase
MIDLHSHILPALDDGPETLEGSLALARAAVEDGIELIAATPHVRDDYPTSADEMERGVASLREALRAAGVGLELRPGGELALERLDELEQGELRRFGLGGSRKYLLVESPYYGWPLDLAARLFRLEANGMTPVLAHPERNAEVQTDPGRLRPLVERGTVVQLTAASVDGRLGRRARETSLRLLELGLAHLLASDAHAPALRAVGLTAAAESLGDDGLAHWLTREVPAALLADEDLPQRPTRKRRRWFSR